MEQKTITVPINKPLLGWAFVALMTIALLLHSMTLMHDSHTQEVNMLRGKIADYEVYIATLDATYDSLLKQEVDLIKRHDEEILTIDTISIDSLRGYFASRYGFFNVFHPDTTQGDSL